ncbi:hypothetical protein GCM10027291_34690 [Telluribacter humicola]
MYVLGVTLLCLSIPSLLDSLTPRNSLIPLKGTLESCDINILTTLGKGRFRSEPKSREAELTFYLYEFKKKFTITENIGSEYRHVPYSIIRKRLNQADSITVWIEKSQLEDWEPKVFQIESEKGLILDFETKQMVERPLAVFLVLGAIVCILFPTYFFYPKLFGR